MALNAPCQSGQSALSRYNDFSQQSYSRSLHISHPHTAWCGVTVRLDLLDRWAESSGHVMRSDTVGVSGRYFSEEKICVVFRVIGRSGELWVSCSSCSTNKGQSRSQSAAAAAGDGSGVELWASSFLIGPGGTGACTCTLRAPYSACDHWCNHKETSVDTGAGESAHKVHLIRVEQRQWR